MPAQWIGTNDPQWMRDLAARFQNWQTPAPPGGLIGQHPEASIGAQNTNARMYAPGVGDMNMPFRPASPMLPQAAPLNISALQQIAQELSNAQQGPQRPQPGGAQFGLPSGPRGHLGGQLGGGNGIQHMLQRLAQSQQSPMPARPRPPQMPAPQTGAFAGNAQGSVVGDMGPTPQMGGYVPTGGDLNELPQEALGGARALPNTFGSMYGQALPQQRNALSALLAAITRRG